MSEQDNSDYYELSRHIVLAARRPLSLPEFHHAMQAGLSASLVCDPLANMKQDLIIGSQGELEVSGGIRPIVQFKIETPLGGNVEAHEALALCCLRTLTHANKQYTKGTRRQFIDSQCMPFLPYAIEYILRHTDNSETSTREAFCEEFDYGEWQRWAVCLPALAALYTYDFGEALIRFKCHRLWSFVRSYDSALLRQGTSIRPYRRLWPGLHSAQQLGLDKIRSLAPDDNGESSISHQGNAESSSRQTTGEPSTLADGPHDPSTPPKAESTYTESSYSESTFVLTPSSSSINDSEEYDFVTQTNSPATLGNPDFDDLDWEDVELQSILLESIRSGSTTDEAHRSDDSVVSAE